MPRTIGVISGKGGVGKTTLVANLGAALSKLGRRPTLVDCNITTSHLGFCFGLFFYEKTLNHVLKKEATLPQAIYSMSGVKIIPASLELEHLVDVDINELKSTIEKIKYTDIILLDSAPGFGREAMSVLDSSSEVIFVTTPHVNAIADIIRGFRIIKKMDIMPLGIVLNMVRGKDFELMERDVEELTGLPVIAKIPFDINVQRSLAKGVPTVLYNSSTPSSIEMMKFAASLVGEYYSKPGIFSRIFEYFRSPVQ